ncbi:hypothetical protein Csa_019247 [Cucumis sativus]|nr:hypothetical protein Csa_019247 [Cucumis sativus]
MKRQCGSRWWWNTICRWRVEHHIVKERVAREMQSEIVESNGYGGDYCGGNEKLGGVSDEMRRSCGIYSELDNCYIGGYDELLDEEFEAGIFMS